MSSQPLAILSTGLVSPVGLTAPAACAAIRAKVTNPQQTRFMGGAGWITGHPVPLEQCWRGEAKLARMAAMAIRECLAEVSAADWGAIPLCLCVAEPSRPGRVQGFDDLLCSDIEAQLDTRFSPESTVIAEGRTSIASALARARQLVYGSGLERVLICGADSLLTWPQLAVFDRQERLLNARNSNGFVPGEAAGAILVGRPGGDPQLLCTGIGFGLEQAKLDSDQPLRADGLVQAFRGALAEAGCALHDLDFRLADLSGEQYYFKEAALAMGRVMREIRERFDLWHTAECTGEVGAAGGVIALTVMNAACRKSYAPGPGALFHASTDSGERAALVLKYGVR